MDQISFTGYDSAFYMHHISDTWSMRKSYFWLLQCKMIKLKWCNWSLFKQKVTCSGESLNLLVLKLPTIPHHKQCNSIPIL